MTYDILISSSECAECLDPLWRGDIVVSGPPRTIQLAVCLACSEKRGDAPPPAAVVMKAARYLRERFASSIRPFDDDFARFICSDDGVKDRYVSR